MLISVTIIIFILLHSPVKTDNAKAYNDLYSIYDDLEGDGSLVDVSQREYNQETTQPSVKMEREDPSVSLGLPPNSGSKPSTFYDRSISNSPFSSNKRISNGKLNSQPQAFNPLNPDKNVFPGFDLSSKSNGRSGFSYNGGSGISIQGSNAFGSNGFPENSRTGNYFGGINDGGGFGSSRGSFGGGSDGGYHNLQPIIHKSVYVHIAPPEEEAVPKQKVIIPKIPPKKNYQIVFIKAPTPPAPSVPIIPPFPTQSDKTLIYVLHPKPEEAPPIHIPAPPQSLPVKPEVYFIRYKSKNEESGDSASGGVDGYHRRRFGGRHDEEVEEESLNSGDTDSRPKSVSPELDVPVNQYEDVQNDSSGESSNIVHVNAH